MTTQTSTAVGAPAPARRQGEPQSGVGGQQGPQVRAHPNVVLAVIATGAVAALWLWWRDTPSVHGLGDWLTNAGRITGLLAGYGVVVLVALMARIPPLERGIGADKLARWHAHGGRYSVCLIAAHAALITWGYAVTAHTDVISQSGTLLSSYPDVLMATAGGALFVATGVVSARAARRRMRYETWFYLHLYTYLAIALAFSHQFADGAEFVDNRPARFAWSALYISVAAALIWYRLVVPVVQGLRHQLRVEAVVPEAPGIVSVIVSGRGLDRLQAESGQFFRWRFLTRELWWASNPYSLSAAPRPDRLRITVRDLGSHSAELARLRPGMRVLTEGPYGAMTARRRRARPAGLTHTTLLTRKTLLIAGGIGISPLRALFETVDGDVTLLYRTSRVQDVAFRSELAAIANARGARVHLLTGSRAQLGHDPLSAAALTANVPDLHEHDVFVCGPEPMNHSVIAALRSAGVPRRQIHHESFEF